MVSTTHMFMSFSAEVDLKLCEKWSGHSSNFWQVPMALGRAQWMLPNYLHDVSSHGSGTAEV